MLNTKRGHYLSRVSHRFRDQPISARQTPPKHQLISFFSFCLLGGASGERLHHPTPQEPKDKKVWAKKQKKAPTGAPSSKHSLKIENK